MHPRNALTSVLALLLGCPLPPELVTCEEATACGTTQPGSTGNGGPPTTSEGVNTVTGDEAVDSDSTAAPNEETGADTTGTTGEAAEPPLIISRIVMPNYTAVNALLEVSVIADHADGVRMLLENGELSELSPLGLGEFAGTIKAFTGLDNGQHTAIFTPWREDLLGEPAEADYVIALPKPGEGSNWDVNPLDVVGNIAALGVLPDGRPVEFVTFEDMGAPRCYLRRREKNGDAGSPVPVLEGAHCTAIDMTIDRETGVIHLLMERKSGDGPSRPGLVAVCGSKPVETLDERDALVVLLRDGQLPEERPLDYLPPGDLKGHKFAENSRDCAFADNTLVLVGEAFGRHELENLAKRDRLMLIEVDTAAETESKWTVLGPEEGIQSRALAVAVDDQHRYHVAGYICFDVCEPVGEIRGYEPGGELFSKISLGPLGSAWFGPHDIAWSPAGYAVVALGAKKGQSTVFKVQAFKPNVPKPMWTFLSSDNQGLARALALAVGFFGEVYAGGTGADDHPAFVVIGS